MNPLYLQAAAALTTADYTVLQGELSGAASIPTPSRRKSRAPSAPSSSPVPEECREPEEAQSRRGEEEPELAPSGEDGRRRQHIPHDWPPVGAILTAEYYGQQYRAVVIPAKKKLLSGRQLKIESGPAAGEICDSLSAAMIAATEDQRRQMKLRRKGVANGWDFWQWDGK